ncbi:protein PFC0760c-like [Nylanderia fulva]|uniref:protein PFC0760c-like n=1 Tax=Nylanderia fulva TaxID=613905 RepID=UPI0010FAFDBD|nr:protein PFC0760c-like [Nylanderia fulva]
MRLSTIFELLLILLLVAFAAYGRVIDRDEMTHRIARAANSTNKSGDMGLSTMSLKQATDSVNRYCTCNENICNCCRDFHIPVVQLKGPGCASLQYLKGDNLAVQLSFGDNILTSTIVNGKSPKPVCVPLPGGFTKFCGRIYSIQRDAKNHFKACLGLELQSTTELEASLRVSCFRFGPDGLKLRPAEPLPVVEAESVEEDDDDDFFGFGSDDDDEEEDEERPSFNSVPDASGTNEPQESDDDDDDDDILGFSALLDIFTGDDDTATKRPKVTTAAPLLEFTIPIITRPTTSTSLEDPELSNIESENNEEEHEDSTQEPGKVVDEESTGSTESNAENNTDENQELVVTEASNKVTYLAKPNKAITNKVKKGVVGDKKPSVTFTNINAIHDPEKPVKKPIKDDEDDDVDDILDDDDDEDVDEDDDETLDDDDEDKNDEDEDEDNDDKLDDEKHEEYDIDDDEDDEKAEDLSELDDDDDDDEEEEAVLTALMDAGKSRKDKGNATNVDKHDNEDYDAELDFLGRKHSNKTRQSKLARLPSVQRSSQ